MQDARMGTISVGMGEDGVEFLKIVVGTVGNGDKSGGDGWGCGEMFIPMQLSSQQDFFQDQDIHKCFKQDQGQSDQT